MSQDLKRNRKNFSGCKVQDIVLDVKLNGDLTRHEPSITNFMYLLNTLPSGKVLSDPSDEQTFFI